MLKKRCCANIYRRGFPFQIACTYPCLQIQMGVVVLVERRARKRGCVIFKRIRYIQRRTCTRVYVFAWPRSICWKEGRKESLVILFAMTFARLAKYECTYMKGGTGILRRRAININVHGYKSLSLL